VTTRADGPQVQIAVADSGEGIAAQHLPHIFERFYRADPARDRAHGGSGIGLTIARALVTAHGGTLTATSNGPGTGAEFTITLPGSTSS
jgi:signal transduction histidine kinase